MPSKSNRSDTAKAKSSQSKTFEKSSGSENSSLDPKRSGLARIEDNSQTVTGQLSGDAQSLSQQELSNSQSVEELVEEGQDLEGELVEGIGNVPAPDQGDVKTHGSPEPEDSTPAYKDRNRL